MEEKLKEAKRLYKSANADQKYVLECLFPELAESEDDRIRKNIISWLKNIEGQTIPINDYNSAIDWLEKQGEKPIGIRSRHATGKLAKIIKDIESEKVEPKFKVGDWIACEDFNTIKIINIVDNKYEVEFIDGIDGNKSFPHIDYIDRNFHLWTIEDAKAGDILAVTMYPEGTWIGIFKEQNGCTFSSYCFVNTKGIFTRGTHGHGNGEGIHPATEEQRNILFTKMKEAGYTFDFEKKELKEMEQNLAWREKYIADVFEKVGLAKIARKQSNDNLTNALQDAMIELSKFISQLKREWSEEDEKMFDYALSMIEWYSCKSSFVSDWLKSLKDRYTWKPSDKQINTLEYYIHTLVCNEHKEILFGLYTDLKKLREE